MPLIGRGPGVRVRVKGGPAGGRPIASGVRIGSVPGTTSYGATPAVPATAPPSPVKPPPFDPQFEGQVGLNTRTYNDTITGLGQEESGTLRAYGLDDTSDPFSRAALLRQAYQQRARGAGNAMAARGQLYSGAYQNAQNSAATGFAEGTDALRKSQNSVLESIVRRRATARTNLDQGNLDASGEAIGRAVVNRPDPATIPVPRDKNVSKLSVARHRRQRRIQSAGRSTYGPAT